MTPRRNTKQKLLILDYLKNHPTHPTTENIYHQLKKSLPNLTLATVYRNLHILTEEQQILTLNINNELHFDGTTQPHLHLICQKCNKISDIMISELHHKFEKKFQTNQFQPNTTSYISYGHCQKCISLKENTANVKS